MGTFHLSLLYCDCCNRPYTPWKALGRSINEQRKSAKSDGWQPKSGHQHSMDLCALCLPQETHFDPFDTADEGEVPSR